ncbi:MAG: hypothetical protein ACTSPL_02745 [Candidatus Odinarchaeia archaeon]
MSDVDEDPVKKISEYIFKGKLGDISSFIKSYLTAKSKLSYWRKTVLKGWALSSESKSNNSSNFFNFLINSFLNLNTDEDKASFLGELRKYLSLFQKIRREGLNKDPAFSNFYSQYIGSWIKLLREFEQFLKK